MVKILMQCLSSNGIVADKVIKKRLSDLFYAQPDFHFHVSMMKPSIKQVEVWNGDVRFYRIKDLSGKPISYFYFDLYSRPAEKRGGEWMDEVVARNRVLSAEKRGGASTYVLGYVIQKD